MKVISKNEIFSVRKSKIKLYKALAGFQQECPVIHQGTKGYGYTYASLTEILSIINPIMKKHNLGFLHNFYLPPIIKTRSKNNTKNWNFHSNFKNSISLFSFFVDVETLCKGISSLDKVGK